MKVPAFCMAGLSEGKGLDVGKGEAKLRGFELNRYHCGTSHNLVDSVGIPL